MLKHLRRLWIEEGGAIISSELVLFSTVVVIGMLTGLQTVREAVVEELGDFANAIGNINQSYHFDPVAGHHSATAGSFLIDARDDCDTQTPVTCGTPMCIVVGVCSASHERDLQPLVQPALFIR